MANDKLNQRIEKVKIMQLNIGEPKQIATGKNQGKNYWRIGIKSPDGWMNMTVFSEDDMNKCRQLEDQTIHLSVWEEEWKDKSFTNCGFPDKKDVELADLQDKMAGVVKFIRYYCDKNPGAAEELKNYTN